MTEYLIVHTYHHLISLPNNRYPTQHHYNIIVHQDTERLNFIMAKYVSSTQKLRQSYNYREAYFKQNPGIFGCIWICSQCYKPLFGKKNVVVDHIIPLNKGGRNHVSNCTACCSKCNLSKSDKVDGRVIKGKIFKIFESSSFGLFRGLGFLSMFTVNTANKAIKGGTKHIVIPILGNLIAAILTLLKIIFYPILHGSIMSRVFAICIYLFLGTLIFKSDGILAAILAIWN